MKDMILKYINKDVTLRYTSDVVLLGGKKNEQQGRVTKESVVICTILGSSDVYSNAMKQLDETFVVKPRPWGVRIESGLIEHKEVLYVEIIVKENIETTHFLDNETIEKCDIIGLKPSSTEPKTVDLRCIKVSNIISIH